MVSGWQEAPSEEQFGKAWSSNWLSMLGMQIEKLTEGTPKAQARLSQEGIGTTFRGKPKEYSTSDLG